MAAVVQNHALEQADPTSDQHRAAVHYLQRCVAKAKPCAVVTGHDDAQRAAVLAQLVGSGRRLARDYWAVIPAPTDSVQSFMEALLAQLGYTLHDAEAVDLQGLLSVFLRHEGEQGRRVIVVMDEADEFGPRVLDVLDQLFRVRKSGVPAISLVLAGRPDLERVLESPGMARLASMTRERFDLDGRGVWQAPLASAAAQASRPAVPPNVVHSLTVLLDGQVVQRATVASGRLLLGRTRQSDLRLGGRFVSRHHALVIIVGGSAFIADLRSTNGTRVNGRPIRQQLLQPGDLIDIGNFQLRYEAVAAGPVVVPDAPVRIAADSARASST